MTNPIIDQERAAFLSARSVLKPVSVPAWPRASKDLNLVELETTWVRFSTLNHRTRAEQRAEIARSGISNLFSDDPLGPAAQEAQFNILSDQAGFDELKKDLEKRGQQEPALVTADGILINGNRRAAALRSLYQKDDHGEARYIQCVVLPADATREELVDLETELQIARDFKQEYGWINEAFLIEELFERENKDFARVATRMHRELADIRSQYEKLQHVRQLVELSGGVRQFIGFDDNESAFEELAKHVKNKQPAEAESVRSVYFLGTLTDVKYRKLRHLRRQDAASLVRGEIESDPFLKQLLDVAESESKELDSDVLDDVLGGDAAPGALTPLLAYIAQKREDESIVLPDGSTVDVKNVLDSIQSAIVAAADEAEEEQRDQTAQSTPLSRTEKAISEFKRALSSLPRARAFEGFDEAGMTALVTELGSLANNYLGEKR